MQKGFVNFVLGSAPHRLDYLNVTCSWGEARIGRRTGLGSRGSCLQILARTKWVLIIALSGNSSISNLEKATELQAKALASKLNETHLCLLPVWKMGVTSPS